MKVKKILIFFILNAQPFFLFAQQRVTIAVMELDPLGVSKIEAKIITSRLRSYLVNIDRFIVLERENMEEILKEQGFQLSGCTSDECVVDAGKLLNVQEILFGSIGKIGSLYTLSIRLIDIESGKIKKSVNVDCNCNIEDVMTKSIPEIISKIINNKKELEYININKIIKKNIFNIKSVIYLGDYSPLYGININYLRTLSTKFKYGFGIEIDSGTYGYMIPLYLTSNYTILVKSFSPYLTADFGYSILSKHYNGFLLNLGLGFRYFISNNLGFNIEFTLRQQKYYFPDIDFNVVDNGGTIYFGIIF